MAWLAAAACESACTEASFKLASTAEDVTTSWAGDIAEQRVTICNVLLTRYLENATGSSFTTPDASTRSCSRSHTLPIWRMLGTPKRSRGEDDD